jgi:hypothetical protein
MDILSLSADGRTIRLSQAAIPLRSGHDIDAFLQVVKLPPVMS